MSTQTQLPNPRDTGIKLLTKWLPVFPSLHVSVKINSKLQNFVFYICQNDAKYGTNKNCSCFDRNKARLLAVHSVVLQARHVSGIQARKADKLISQAANFFTFFYLRLSNATHCISSATWKQIQHFAKFEVRVKWQRLFLVYTDQHDWRHDTLNLHPTHFTDNKKTSSCQFNPEPSSKENWIKQHHPFGGTEQNTCELALLKVVPCGCHGLHSTGHGFTCSSNFIQRIAGLNA